MATIVGYVYFRVKGKPVTASVSFPPEIKEGDTATGTITIYPSPSPTPVTLSLATTNGTGSAAFASPTTFTQSGSFQITGVQRSSIESNLQLSATANGQTIGKTYFTVSTVDLAFPTGIAKGHTASATVTLSPSPAALPVTLKLETTSGTGSAVFASNNSNTLDVYDSGTVQIKGTIGSSVSKNIALTASSSGVERARVTFSVIDATLSCTSPVTRGQSTTCQVGNSPVGSSYAWKFTDSASNQVTANNNNSSWQGTVVTSGTVDVSLDGAPLAPKTLTVNDRANFAFTAVNSTQLNANSISCYDGNTYVLASPPFPLSYQGYSCADMAFDTTRAQVSDGGPNNGYWYVSAVSDQFQAYTTRFRFAVVSDLLSTSSNFYNAQCGTFSSSNTSGYISGSKLLQNVLEHEGGPALSHWTQYRDAQNNPSNNIGLALESVVAPPGTSDGTFAQLLQATGNAALGRIRQAVSQEPCNGFVEYDSAQSCKFCGAINYLPYQSCGGAIPVPYCQ